MEKTIKILAVDDTITYRNILKAAVSNLPGAELIGVASNGITALEKIKQLKPDIVLLDIEMPEMNGLKALEIIRKDFKDVGVVMVSGISQSSAEMTIKALELGAIDFVKKPDNKSPKENIDFIRNHLASILNLIGINRLREKGDRQEFIQRNPILVGESQVINNDPYGLVVFGSSTGGPNALMQILPSFPDDFPLPIVVVQHMPKGFTSSFGKILDSRCQLRVKEVIAVESMKKGNIYLASGGKHLVLLKNRNKTDDYFLTTSNDPPVKNCKPSVDVTLRSIAENYENNVITVILTGMGTDGSNGVRLIRQNLGGYCISQSAESCVVYGMPRAVNSAGLSDYSINLNGIVSKLQSLLKMGAHVSR